MKRPDGEVLRAAAARLRMKRRSVDPTDLADVLAAVADRSLPSCGVCLGHSPYWDGHDLGCPRGVILDVARKYGPD